MLFSKFNFVYVPISWDNAPPNRQIPQVLRFNNLVYSEFGSMVAGAFQIAFRAEIHANDVFLFFKNYF